VNLLYTLMRGGKLCEVAKRKSNAKDLLARARKATADARALWEERQGLCKERAALRKDFERAKGKPQPDITLLRRLVDERKRRLFP
jgi:hypothetical protein